MMEQQYAAKLGERELSSTEVDLINEIKAKGEELNELLKKVRANIQATNEEFGTADSEHYRWVSISKTHFQQGLMALTRAVAKPNLF